MRFALSIFITLILVFSAAPNLTQAASLNTIERQLLLKQIEILQAEIIRLQGLLGGSGAPHVRNTPSTDEEIFPSRFYDGPYEALYFVEGTDLVNRNSGAVRYGDSLLWDFFVELNGKVFVRENLREFRIFNDEENLLTGYVEQRPDGEWILAINRFGDNLSVDYDSESMIELLLHESAHIIFFNNYIYEKEFQERFWETSLMQKHKRALDRADDFIEQNEIGNRFYDKHESLFVSDYAASSLTEDAVESFVHFVLNKKTDGRKIRDKKTEFFYRFPDLITKRAHLRNSGVIDQ